MSKRIHRGGASLHGLDDAFEAIGRLWGLRLLRKADVRGICVASVGGLLGIDDDEAFPPPRKCYRIAGQILEGLQSRSIPEPQPLWDNIALLSKVIPLSLEERRFLAFRAVAERYEPLDNLLSAIGNLSDERLARIVATALEIDPAVARGIVARDARIRMSGLISLDEDLVVFSEKVQVVPGLFNALLSVQPDLDSLLSVFVKKSPAPALTLDEFGHIADFVRLVRPYLERVSRERRKGSNILIHGPAGVGKTELVRALAAAAQLNLYEVEGTRPGADSVEGRFSSFRFAQNLLAGNEQCLILFDEVEDVFPTQASLFSFDGERVSGASKAWTNQLLEENAVPAVWVANNVSHINPAFLRRFDIVKPLGPLPRPVRRRMLEQAVAGLPVSSEWIDRMSEQLTVTPADTERVRRVFASANGEDRKTLEKDLELVLNGHREARAVRPERPAYRKPVRFRLDLLNVDFDLGTLVEGLRRAVRGRMCLYGPPGTGKTAFVHHLGECLDRPVLVKRASDILSMWVGGTEGNIAEMFGEAAADGAVFLLDEADSFLQDRRRASRSWEITQVNELLTQMECFEGLLVCATNRMESLDPAVLRRFHFKVRFAYLTCEQKEECFVAALRDLGYPVERELPPDVRPELSRIRNLTPGDFAAVTEAMRIVGASVSPGQLLRELRKEADLKPEGRRVPPGFV